MIRVPQDSRLKRSLNEIHLSSLEGSKFDADKFDFAIASPVNSERWLARQFNGTLGTGAADINTTVSGKAYLKATPVGAAGDPIGYSLQNNRYIGKNWVATVDVNATFGTDAVSWPHVGIRVLNDPLDALNQVLIGVERSTSGGGPQRITAAAFFNNVAQGAVSFITTESSIGLKMERSDNIFRVYYSLTQKDVKYTWVLLAEYEDVGEHVTEDAKINLVAYSPGNNATQTAQGDFFNFVVAGTVAEKTEELHRKVGERTDKSFSDVVGSTKSPTIFGHLKAGYFHVHAPSKMHPRLADAVAVTNDDAGSPAGAWTEGSKQTIIGAGAITTNFDIHWIKFFEISDADECVLTLYNGADNIGEVGFSRVNNFISHLDVPLQIPPQPANAEITATLACKGGAAARSVKIKMFYHEYPDMT